jgi:dolichyl-phosphate-mannose-protein mannosyltransferase
MPQSETSVVVVDEALSSSPHVFAPDANLVVRAAPALAMLVVTIWVCIVLATSSGQLGDHFEQFTWAHSLQWGYHKHPPLPTWMLATLIAVLGPSVWSAQLLAWLCTLGTAFFTHRVARILFGDAVAALAVLLWGLQHAFSSRAALFNHNTVLMLTISITAWCLLRALQKDERAARWWLATGVAAGLSLLAKYQALVPLAGMLVAVFLSRDAATPAARRGLLLAVVTALLIVMPHLLWVLDDHFTTLEYATQQGHHPSVADLALSIASFLAQQLRMILPALLLCGALLLLPGAHGVETAVGGREPARRRAWLLGLVGVPLALTVLTAPLFGLLLQNHWGYQALQFFGLWLAWRIRPRIVAAGPAWIGAALLVQSVFMAVTVLAGDPLINGHRHDRHYPAQQLADSVRTAWRDDSLCPLKIVVGPTFEAGIVSVYSGGRARVLEDGDFANSPWISPADLERSGAAYVATDPARLPTKGVASTGYFDAPRLSADVENRVYWAIVPPLTCSGEP